MTLDELSAHEEIRQAIYRHFRAGDRLDATLDATAFWDDGIYEGGPFDGPVGENMPVLYSETMAKLFTITNHYIMNMVIDLRVDTAFLEIYAIDYHVVPPDSFDLAFGKTKAAELDASKPHELVMGVRYPTKMERRGGVWKIAVMKLILDWNHISPYNGIREGGVYDILKFRGTRDRADPSYSWTSPAF